MVYNFLPVAYATGWKKRKICIHVQYYYFTRCTSFETIYFYRSLLKGDFSEKPSDIDEETQGSQRMGCMNVFLWMSMWKGKIQKEWHFFHEILKRKLQKKVFRLLTTWNAVGKRRLEQDKKTFNRLTFIGGFPNVFNSRRPFWLLDSVSIC